MSLEARDLIKEALGTYEDKYWLEKAEEREKTFDRNRARSHNQVWE